MADGPADDHHHRHPGAPSPSEDPREHWDRRYGSRESIWSGRVNATLAAAVGDLAPGRAIDLGCGEGADALWLAANGWEVLGLDLSAVAVRRARREAAARDLPGARFSVQDLDTWELAPASADLVTASFLHSEVALDRLAILRRAAGAVAAGGHLVVVSHAAPPPWADLPADSPHRSMPTAVQELAALGLADAAGGEAWDVVVAEQRPRTALSPEGVPGELEDSLLVLRRRDGGLSATPVN